MSPPLTGLVVRHASHAKHRRRSFCDREGATRYQIARRNYEGATEVQNPIVTRELLKVNKLTWRQAIE